MFFDSNNIITLKDYKKLSLTIIKIYLYFNQIDDNDLVEFIDDNDLLNKNIDGLEDIRTEILNSDHYINIKLCGPSSSGKSTFINTILGEKRDLAKISTGTTKKGHIFISQKYRLKLIDDLGFDEGDEGERNEEIFKSLTNDKHRIIIDEAFERSYGYNNDFQNKYHLLLYFLKYESYNIIQEHINFVNKLNNDKIPIIFVISFCEDDDIFNGRNEFKKNGDKSQNGYTDYVNLIEIALKQKEQNEYIDKKKIPINCLKKKGLGDLFEEIYNVFKNKIIQKNYIDKLEKDIETGSKDNDPNKDIKNNFFLKDIKIKDIISPQMKASVLLVKDLILKLTGQYSGKLEWMPAFKFSFSRMWNNLRKVITYKRPNNEFYPLLTELVLKIFRIFGDEEKNVQNCNEYIKTTIYKYFKINENGEISYETFKKDIRKYRNLFNNTKKYYEIEETIQDNILERGIFEINADKFTNTGKFLLEQEKYFFDIEITNEIKKSINNRTISEDDETDYHQDNILDNSKTKLLSDDSNLIDNEIKEEKDLEPNDSNKYINDFKNISEQIINYIKKNFGEISGDNILENRNDKILLKIFLINLVCRELTKELCQKNNSQSINEYLKNLAEEYNKSINGLKMLAKEFQEKNEIQNK